MSSARRSLRGTAVALGVMAALTAAMIPFCSRLSAVTDRPIRIIQAVSGGFGAGVTGIIAGFLVYDFVFTPPYCRPWVGKTENWLTTSVYLVAMLLLVARVVSNLAAARLETTPGGAARFC